MKMSVRKINVNIEKRRNAVVQFTQIVGDVLSRQIVFIKFHKIKSGEL